MEYEYKVRVYPTLPAQEVHIVKFFRLSLPKNLNSVHEKWNFNTMAWDAVKPMELDTIPGPYCLGLPGEALRTFSVELLKGALRVENE